MRLCRGSGIRSRCRQTEAHSIIPRPAAMVVVTVQSMKIKRRHNVTTTTATAKAIHGGSNAGFRSAFIVGDNNGEAMQMPAAHKAFPPSFFNLASLRSRRGVRIFPLSTFAFPSRTRALSSLFTLLLARRNVCIARPAERSGRPAWSVCRFHEFHL